MLDLCSRVVLILISCIFPKLRKSVVRNDQYELPLGNMKEFNDLVLCSTFDFVLLKHVVLHDSLLCNKYR
jgi:hypothetical protein